MCEVGALGGTEKRGRFRDGQGTGWWVPRSEGRAGCTEQGNPHSRHGSQRNRNGDERRDITKLGGWAINRIVCIGEREESRPNSITRLLGHARSLVLPSWSSHPNTTSANTHPPSFCGGRRGRKRRRSRAVMSNSEGQTALTSVRQCLSGESVQGWGDCSPTAGARCSVMALTSPT